MGTAENLSLEVPGPTIASVKCLAETNSIMNGIHFHTWFVQAHLISSRLFNVFFKNVNTWMKLFFVSI